MNVKKEKLPELEEKTKDVTDKNLMDKGLFFLWMSKESRFHEIESTPDKEAVQFIEMTTKNL